MERKDGLDHRFGHFVETPNLGVSTGVFLPDDLFVRGKKMNEKKEGCLKIYFAGAIRGGREDVSLYHELIQFLRSFGDVLTEHVGDTTLTEAGDDGPNDRAIHDRDMTWLNACDLIVAEVTIPSLGVGYELGWATSLHKPVLALYRPKNGKHLSAMIAGSERIVTALYSDLDEAKSIIRRFLGNISRQKNGGTP